ncbi:MAG: glutamate 5-kinase [Patescibacteria group bacterium]
MIQTVGHKLRILDLAQHDWIVVKIGTSTLAPDGKIDTAYLDNLAGQIANINHERWLKTILVTSGAILAGRDFMRLSQLYRVDEKQAAAAIGQPLLMKLYREAFASHNHHVAQVLLTKEDCLDSIRTDNVRQMFFRLFSWNTVPIVNENDSVATEEIVFGDNDLLAAHVAVMANCKAVFLLTDVDGYLDGQGAVVPYLLNITDDMINQAKLLQSNGTGGIASKLAAGQITSRNEIPLIIANGREPDVLNRIVQGASIGTLCS